ncbi:MAG: protein-L-isoaspartate(D-aspartate) O-methyltransferase [Acidobacteria bacterium]|nr:protein-L-isoaspartate(D-aspartate) O-methyltransferase [Acidobacteriota bacterium]
MLNLLLFVLALLAVPFALLWASDPYQKQREQMVKEQIEARGVRRPDVLAAMGAVPRHLFVPPDLAPQAYADHPLPIGEGQTISQPYIVAFMTELLEVGAADRVLEIGTGSGYQAAVLARLAKSVYTIEIVRSLGEQAAARLRAMGYKNVEVRVGNGYNGWPEQAPFDRIIVTAAPPSIPQALIDQLKPGGKLVAPVGREFMGQDLVVLEKSRSGRISTRKVLPVAFVPMVKP